jgi:hypothetical protein
LPGRDSKRVLATELLLHSAYVADLILKGAVDEIRHAIEKSGGVGMHTFDQVLLELFNAGRIDQDTALANADSRTDLSLRMQALAHRVRAADHGAGQEVGDAGALLRVQLGQKILFGRRQQAALAAQDAQHAPEDAAGQELASASVGAATSGTPIIT